jgi:UDP-N-acetylmuramoyl-tripeptide--D-alanyl-D-alanine ligase
MRPLLEESAEAMYQAYVVEALRQDPDSDLTKGFYQWGSMALLEMYDAGWDRHEEYAERCIELAHWMIDVHRTLERRRNTAYAMEGLICAWELARRTGDTASQRKIGAVIDEGLYKLTTWQFGSPVANDYLRGLTEAPPAAVGGVMSAADDPRLRIDTTQHQMHAVILARKFIYR